MKKIFLKIQEKQKAGKTPTEKHIFTLKIIKKVGAKTPDFQAKKIPQYFSPKNIDVIRLFRKFRKNYYARESSPNGAIPVIL